MKVFLAGHNVDLDLLNEIKLKFPELESKLTPETISASYARISRDSRPINELRADARNEVEKARKSNTNIIFGMGHSSIAEHAVFNFDIIGLSRLAIEELEHFRLASYTEKSQRYITLTNDFVVPQELDENDAQKFKDIILLQNVLYHEMFAELRSFVFSTNAELAKEPKNHRMLEGWAKEDARYISALATEGQLGMTLNARTLEHMLRRFSASKLAEVRDLGKKMYESVKNIAPSLIKYTEASEYEKNSRSYFPSNLCGTEKIRQNAHCVNLVDYTSNMDEKILAAMLFGSSNLSYDETLEKLKTLKQQEKQNILKCTFKDLKFYHPMIREFEFGEFVFELNISSACFGQLKRHRMSSIITQNYEPSLGLEIPEAILKIGYEKLFREIAEKSMQVHAEFKQKYGAEVAEYVLTNAHKRKVLIKLNARELYHLSRLREDAHAQWDIKNITAKMTELAKNAAPMTMFLIGGKDQFEDIHKGIYSYSEKPEPKPPYSEPDSISL